MKVTRFEDATPYVAPNHFEMCSLRLQGFEPGGPQTFWTGLSHFLPGGGAGPGASPLERVYVVLTGELWVKVGDEEVVLRALDSVCIPGNESRELRNKSHHVTSMLVIMPYPPA